MASVRIVEMALRDGLQNEKHILSVADRIEFAKRLVNSGSKEIEMGAFVSPSWVPQMAATDKVIEGFKKSSQSKSVQMSALIPNIVGFEKAMSLGLKEVAVFTAASESFTRKNINCSISESFQRFEKVFAAAKKNKVKVRGYLSTAFGCPFEGAVSEARVVQLASKLIEMGAYEVSIGDTIGIAHAGQVHSLFKKLLKKIPAKKLAGHFHDTRGQALVNISAAFAEGIRTFDSSLGGLGGCPYAPGASGNVATEDVVYFFHGMKVATGLNLDRLLETHRWLSKKMHKGLPSKLGSAYISAIN